MMKHVNGREVSRDDPVKIRCHPGASTDGIIDYVRLTARKKPDMTIINTCIIDIQEIKLTHLEKLERSLLPLKKSMLTMKYKLLSEIFTAIIKASRKKLKKSTESWRIYVRVKGLSSLIILILMVHALIEANYT